MSFDLAAAHAAIDQLGVQHLADLDAAVKAATAPLTAQINSDLATIADLRAQLANAQPGIRHSIEDVIYDKFGAPVRTDKMPPAWTSWGKWGAQEAPLGMSNKARDWYAGARPGVEPPYPATYAAVGGYDHHNVWGQVLPVDGGMPAAHRSVRLQMAIPQVWHLEAGVWSRKKSDAEIGKALNGGYWNGGSTYSKTIDWPSTEPNPYWRHEPDGTLSIDLTPTTGVDGKPLDSQCIAHFFFPAFFPRQPILPGAQVAIVGAMRLIPGTPGVDVTQAKFVGCLGGDMFPDATTSIGAGNKNPPIGLPRHRLFTDKWRHVGYVTGTEAQIRTYPPMPFLTA